MSGGGGHIIIQHAKIAMSDPLVHGNLPDAIKALIDPILAKEDAQWSVSDKLLIAHAYNWALCNID